MLGEIFQACKLEPVTTNNNGEPTTILPSTEGTKWKTTSFFLDSSGRSSFMLPLQLTFASKENLDEFLAANCLGSIPSNIETKRNDDSNPHNESFVGFEVKSFPVNELKPVVVEGMTVLSCYVDAEKLSVIFNIEITLRASSPIPTSPGKAMSSPKKGVQDLATYSVDVNLDITPVLSVKHIDRQQEALDVPDLRALELGAIPDHMQRESTSRLIETRLNPVPLLVTLTQAFCITVKSTSGPTQGVTFVSLTVCHSNSHSEPLTITSIDLHPGHSRQDSSLQNKQSRNTPRGQYSVTNMTKAVQWGYAPRTELKLPLTINPHDAYSTVICVNAGEEMRSRSYLSPVSVTGVIGSEGTSIQGSANNGSRRRQRIVVAADAPWTTGLVAVEPADAFRVEMKLKEPECIVGQTMVVSIRIFNLSMESRDLMLLMAKDDQKRDSSKDEAVNTALVSDVDGYTFGVWGISGEDDGTTRLNRDCDLLAVDAAILLGQVMGQHAVDAELRFVPLREGPLRVPNWKLYDKSAGRWYNCIHKLKIVGKASN